MSVANTTKYSCNILIHVDAFIMIFTEIQIQFFNEINSLICYGYYNLCNYTIKLNNIKLNNINRLLQVYGSLA